MSKKAAFAVAIVGVTTLGGYLLGVRPLGTALPPQFRRPPEEHYASLAKHREEQRTQAVAEVPGAAVNAPAPPSTAVIEPVRGETPAAARDPLPAYWTGFRGPTRDGIYRQRSILTNWPAVLKPLWKQPVGAGHASFAIARGRAFTIEQRAGDETVAAYDLGTGRELWSVRWPAAFREAMGGDGPRATPTWHDGRVYALGAEGELRALHETDGRQLWRRNILEDAGAANLEWGMASSALVVDDLVVLTPGGRSGHSVVAYDRVTGRPAWSALDDRQSYTSPQLATIHGTVQVLVFSSSRLVSITPEGGAELWEFPWRGGGGAGINVAQPIVLDDRVFVSTGYGIGSAMIQIERVGEQWSARELWRTSRMKNQFTSSVHHEGFIYGLDEGILACLDAATGERRWKGGRYGDGQVLLARGHLIVSTDSGDLVLVRATAERHEEVARSVAIEGRTWNHPAIAEGVLLIRNSNEMAAFDLNRR